MSTCPSCNAEQLESNAYCSACGTAMQAAFAATIAQPTGDSPPANRVVASLSGSAHHGRFLPGSRVADRYRIVSLVGKGGMGEVYRADDLKLGQTVALKFLPVDLGQDPQRLQYFLSEVRLTRQISHANVCRVYDIGEFEGQHYLSMEYIDGEDLRVLLRRIGRLPQGKGVQIAQQLCAGLAAAHERGVLHRDLKPANIMIDGHGQVRITDFGLAQLMEEGSKAEIAGTPAYMAPEQLTRGEATIQSDLFALGLVLSEVFTGQAVFKSGSIPDLIRAHESSLSQTLTLPEDLEPRVQHVIRSCLERDPHERPASARAVAAGLPGGDPLAAAMAAGETPSPEMVAAAGEMGQLSLRTAGVCLAALLVGLVFLVLIMGRESATINLDKEKSGDAYAQDARVVLQHLGLYDPEDYEDWGFVKTNEKQRRMEFWYRRSPQQLLPVLDSRHVRDANVVTLQNPPPLIPGMVSVRLNSNGALRELLVVPSKEVMAKLPDAAAIDWKNDSTHNFQTELIKNASLDESVLKPDPVKWSLDDLPDWTPPASDNAYSRMPDNQVIGGGSEPEFTRINVAELNERIVFFHVADDAAPNPLTFAPLKVKGQKLGPALSVLITLIAMVLAWRNVLAGRSDLRGGRRLALFVFIVSFANSTLGSVLAPSFLFTGLLLALASAARFWIYYVALEPLARRYWPEILVNWSRGLAGRVLDPGIGRDILLGMLTGVLFTLLAFGLLGVEAKTNPQTLCGTRFLFAQLAERLEGAFGFPLQIAVIMVLMRIVFRNNWAPVIAAACIIVLAWHPELFKPTDRSEPDSDLQYLANIAAYYLYYATTGVLIARLGVLAASSFMLCHGIFRFFPWTADWGGPDLPGSVFAVVAILICAAYGFYTSVGGPSTLRDRAMNVT